MLLTVLLFALAGLLLGGAISLRRQGSGWWSVILLALLAALALAAGVART
jgi:hypothetical protein